MPKDLGKGVSWRTTKARVAAKGVALLLAVACSVVFTASVRAADPKEVLEGSGIRFPEGFDLNTLGDVRGKVGQVEHPSTGPVRFRLDAERDSYTVLTAPHWYWSDLNIELAEGAEVVVRGSKTVGVDGHLYIVAQELRVVSTGRVVALRDRGGGPLWTGAGRAGQGGGRGEGGNMGAGRGGTGGAAGMGRGGRR